MNVGEDLGRGMGHIPHHRLATGEVVFREQAVLLAFARTERFYSTLKNSKLQMVRTGVSMSVAFKVVGGLEIAVPFSHARNLFENPRKCHSRCPYALQYRCYRTSNTT
jgi:hypothetical protein